MAGTIFAASGGEDDVIDAFVNPANPLHYSIHSRDQKASENHDESQIH